jgi:hypothetical protein
MVVGFVLGHYPHCPVLASSKIRVPLASQFGDCDRYRGRGAVEPRDLGTPRLKVNLRAHSYVVVEPGLYADCKPGWPTAWTRPWMRPPWNAVAEVEHVKFRGFSMLWLVPVIFGLVIAGLGAIIWLKVPSLPYRLLGSIAVACGGVLVGLGIWPTVALARVFLSHSVGAEDRVTLLRLRDLASAHRIRVEISQTELFPPDSRPGDKSRHRSFGFCTRCDNRPDRGLCRE